MTMLWLLYVGMGVYDWMIIHVNGGVFPVSGSEGQFHPMRYGVL